MGEGNDEDVGRAGEFREFSGGCERAFCGGKVGFGADRGHEVGC